MKPPRYTDDPARFKHVDLYTTNLEATSERVRREQKRAAVEAQPAVPEHRVIPILRSKA